MYVEKIKLKIMYQKHAKMLCVYFVWFSTQLRRAVADNKRKSNCFETAEDVLEGPKSDRPARVNCVNPFLSRPRGRPLRFDAPNFRQWNSRGPPRGSKMDCKKLCVCADR